MQNPSISMQIPTQAMTCIAIPTRHSHTYVNEKQ